MIKHRLLSAMDFAKRKDVTHERETYQKDGKWYIVSRGPKYSNLYEVIEYDDDGLKQLQKLERRVS